MPHHTYKDGDGVEWDVVHIPALIAHGNKMLMIKTQGCWELDSSDRQIAQLIESGYTHNGCVSTASEVMASMFHFDKYGFTRSVRKVRVTPQDPDRHYHPVTVYGVDIEGGREIETRQEIGVQPGSLPNVPLDGGGLSLSDEIRAARGSHGPTGRITAGELTHQQHLAAHRRARQGAQDRGLIQRQPAPEELRQFREMAQDELDSYLNMRNLVQRTYGTVTVTDEQMRAGLVDGVITMDTLREAVRRGILTREEAQAALGIATQSTPPIEDMALDDSERF